MPYSRYTSDELILRDLLARDRTVLANERTVLGYTRTALMFAISGITLIKLFPGDTAARVIGFLLLPVAATTQVLGIVSYIRMRRLLARIGSASASAEAAAVSRTTKD